jgi:hypothetical protein
MDRACRTYEANRNVYRIMVGMPEGKRQLRSPNSGWENNIKIDFREIRMG